MSNTVDRNIRKVGKKYKASITVNGKQVYVGTYESLNEARAARDKAEAKIAKKPHNQAVASKKTIAKYKRELIGKKFGKLTILDVYRERKGKKSAYRLLCRCDCGKETRPYLNSVIGPSAETVSCGCYQGESGKKVLNEYLYQGTRVTNFRTKARNKLGVKGVRLTKYGTYEVSITIKGEYKYLGTYKTLKAAKKARKEAEKEYILPLLKEFNKQAKYKVKIEEECNEAKDKRSPGEGARQVGQQK